MRRAAGLIWFLLLSLTAAAAAGPVYLDITAPGGIEPRGDGSSEARGVDGRPVVAATDEYEITAQSLLYDWRKGTGTAAGNVRWRSRRADQPFELRAEKIAFALAARTLRAEGQVVLNDGNMNLQADSLAADLAAGLYTVSGEPARAGYESHQIQAERLIYSQAGPRTLEASGGLTWRLRLEHGEACQIAADDLTYDLASGRGAATGNVNIESGAVRIAGEQLSYGDDRLAVSGEPTMVRGELRLKAAYLTWQPGADVFTAAGRAEFSDPVFTGSCDELRYVAGENRVFLTGAVRLTRGRDIITGHEAVCDLDAGRVLVTGAAKAVLEG